MFNYDNILLNLKQQLYPSGRAFRILSGSFKEKLHLSYIRSENRAYNEALSVFDSIIPDNDGFSEEDATTWERRLGILTVSGTSFEDRKRAIIRKLQHPGTQKARQHYLYIQAQLRLAGFDVYVHENRFKVGQNWEVKDPETFYPGTGEEIEYGEISYGEGEYGHKTYDLIVNQIDPKLDKFFNYSGLEQTFFISGQNLGDLGTVSEVRKSEFRQLILKLKPVQTVGFIFVNYI